MSANPQQEQHYCRNKAVAGDPRDPSEADELDGCTERSRALGGAERSRRSPSLQYPAHRRRSLDYLTLLTSAVRRDPSLQCAKLLHGKAIVRFLSGRAHADPTITVRSYHYGGGPRHSSSLARGQTGLATRRGPRHTKMDRST
jgi:hypothetical protein